MPSIMMMSASFTTAQLRPCAIERRSSPSSRSSFSVTDSLRHVLQELIERFLQAVDVRERVWISTRLATSTCTRLPGRELDGLRASMSSGFAVAISIVPAFDTHRHDVVTRRDASFSSRESCGPKDTS